MNRNEINNLLKNYAWIMNSIMLERESLKSIGGNLTAKYGIESSLPKASGQTSDPVFKEIVRREKRWKIINKYEKEIQFIQDRIDIIEDERESEVLHWILEGKSFRWIARHMGLSHPHVARLLEKITDRIANVPNVPKLPHFSDVEKHV